MFIDSLVFLKLLFMDCQVGGFVSSVTFKAVRGKGYEGDIALDRIHILEKCQPLNTGQ